VKFFLAIVCLISLSAPLRAAEYYRWIDENGVLHITDNLHNVPPKHREKAGRIQARERPPAAEPARKPPPRKASVPLEKHGEVVVIQATLNNKRSAKFVVDTGASYTLISNALARDLSLEVGPIPKPWRSKPPMGSFTRRSPVWNLYRSAASKSGTWRPPYTTRFPIPRSRASWGSIS